MGVGMSKANELAARLKRFATRIVIFARALPRDPSSEVLARQLTGSGTAESANYQTYSRVSLHKSGPRSKWASQSMTLRENVGPIDAN